MTSASVGHLSKIAKENSPENKSNTVESFHTLKKSPSTRDFVATKATLETVDSIIEAKLDFRKRTVSMDVKNQPAKLAYLGKTNGTAVKNLNSSSKPRPLALLPSPRQTHDEDELPTLILGGQKSKEALL